MDSRLGTARARALVATLLLVVALVAGATAQCGDGVGLRFRPASAPGLRSFVTEAGQPLVVAVSDAAVPAVIVEVRSLAGAADAGADYGFDGELLEATAVPALELQGAAALVSRGVAVFPDLLFVGAVPAGHTLVFTLRAANLSVATAAVHPTTSTAVGSLRLGNKGFFYRAPSAGVVIPDGEAVPPFTVEVVDAKGSPVAATTVVTITADVGTLTGAAVPSAGGVARFDQLTWSSAGAGADPTPTLTIAVAAAGAAPIVLGPLQAAVAPELARYAAFGLGSSVTQENQGGAAVLGVPLPPIIVEARTADTALDVTATGTLVVARCNETELSGSVAVFADGRAVFDRLAFTGHAPRAAVITLTVGSEHPVPMAGQVLVAGSFDVAPAARRARYLRFHPLSGLQAKVALTVAKSASGVFTLPPVVVEVLDSAFRFDPTATSMSLTLDSASTSDAAPQAGQVQTATVSQGLAFFNGLVCDARGSTATFGVYSSDFDPLLSGPITPKVDDAPVDAIAACRGGGPCTVTLGFPSSGLASFIAAEGQPLRATVATALPTVVVQLRDPFGVMLSRSGVTAATAPQVVAYTADTPGAESLLETAGGANVGVWVNGEYFFHCLRFRTAPGSLVTIKFEAQYVPDVSSPAVAYPIGSVAGKARLASGVVTVAAERTPNYGLRFSSIARTPSGGRSAIAFDGDPSAAAVQHLAMPPVRVEITDSTNVFDASGGSDGAVVMVTTSDGVLDPAGTRAAVTKGVATFTALTFITPATSPVLTFTVAGSSGQSNGAVVRSGPVLVTTAAVPEYRLVFLTVENSNVTTVQQGFTFPKLANVEVKATVAVVNSLGVRQRVAGTVEVEATSEEGQLLGTPQQITTATECACANLTTRFLAYKAGVAPGTPLFIRYRLASGTDVARVPSLAGQTLVVGPIEVEDDRAATRTCAANLLAPTVLAEFRISVAAFRADVAAFRGQLAYLMDVEPSRVRIAADDAVSITRLSDTMAPWHGAKVPIVFGAPMAGSANTKSSAQLAAELVELRPRCTAPTLQMESVYYAAEVAQCDGAAFDAAVAEAVQCEAAAILPTCQCFDQHVVSRWGEACAEDAAVKSRVQSVCDRVTSCAEISVHTVCSTILASSAASLLWLWILLGVVGLAAIVVFILWQRGIIALPTRASLSASKAVHDDDD